MLPYVIPEEQMMKCLTCQSSVEGGSCLDVSDQLQVLLTQTLHQHTLAMRDQAYNGLAKANMSQRASVPTTAQGTRNTNDLVIATQTPEPSDLTRASQSRTWQIQTLTSQTQGGKMTAGRVGRQLAHYQAQALMAQITQESAKKVVHLGARGPRHSMEGQVWKQSIQTWKALICNDHARTSKILQASVLMVAQGNQSIDDLAVAEQVPEPSGQAQA